VRRQHSLPDASGGLLSRQPSVYVLVRATKGAPGWADYLLAGLLGLMHDDRDGEGRREKRDPPADEKAPLDACAGKCVLVCV